MSDFVDTNVFVRFLTNGDPAKAAAALALFQRAERGEVRLVTSESVVAEIVYVLSSSIYRVPRAEIADALRLLLEQRGVLIEHKHSILSALDLYEQTNLDFEDCISIAHINRLGLGGIYSYDHHFDRIPSVRRLEP